MADAHAAAVRSAVKTGDDLARLFARLGSEAHPNGAILMAYRTAFRALKGQVKNLAAFADATATLRAAIAGTLAYVYQASITLGTNQAGLQLDAYGLPVDALPDVRASDAIAATLAILDGQITAARAFAMMGDEVMVIGDAGRAGVLQPAPVTADASRWSATLTMLALEGAITGTLDRRGAADDFRRQAIAAIDERTTDCCLKVHGQTVKLDQDFHLTGTPRFADYISKPPFHWNCRTAVALVRAQDAQDELTGQMRDAARAELKARAETGERREIHPAHARSRRG